MGFIRLWRALTAFSSWLRNGLIWVMAASLVGRRIAGSVEESEDGVPHPAHVLGHEPLGAPGVWPLEGLNHRQMLVDETLHPTGREHGHGPHGADLLSDLLERLEQSRIARALQDHGVELLTEGAHVGGSRSGAARLDVLETRLEALELGALEARCGEPHRERLEGLANLIQLAHVIVRDGPHEGSLL